MEPQVQPPQQTTSQPLFNAPYNQPFPLPPTNPTVSPMTPAPTPANSGKLFTLLCIVAAVELIIIIGLMVALASAPKSNKSSAAAHSTSRAGSLDPQPATAVGLQQTDDSISQDISGLNGDRDFPVGRLDDKTLGL